MYTEQVRIYPDEAQRKLIDRILIDSCFLYNKLYDYHEYMYWMYGKSVSQYKYDAPAKEYCLGYDLQLTAIIRRYVINRLYDAYERFFSKQNGYPRHKGLRKFRSFGTRDLSESDMRITGCHVYYKEGIIQLTKKLKIKANFTRPIYGKPKTFTIKKMKTGIYYAFIQIDGNVPAKKYNPDERKPVIALDLGVNKFLTNHLGDYVPQPRFVEYNEKKIRAEQRKLSRMVYGSNNYKKRCEIIARMYEKVSNIRKDWQYKLAYYLVTNYKTIVCENLDVAEMLKKKPKTKYLKKLRRLLKGCSLGQFLTILTYMSQKYNCQLIKVDPMNTSQLCSNCGAMVPKAPGQHHNCPHCGLQADRDINAARNIYERGMGQKFSGGTTVNGASAPLVLVKAIIVER